MSTPIGSLWLAGATGLVGHQALQQALADPGLHALHAVVRRAWPASTDRRLQTHVVDFTAMPALPPAGPEAAALCALGTTIKLAGSQAAFRAVDHDAVVAFASAARAAGVRRLALVSAMGAQAGSAVFYNRVKGETEAAVQSLGFDTLVIARPSLLVGDRAALGQPVRAGERWGLAISRGLGPLIPARWRPIEAAVVARALLRALTDARPGVQTLESDALQQLGRA